MLSANKVFVGKQNISGNVLAALLRLAVKLNCSEYRVYGKRKRKPVVNMRNIVVCGKFIKVLVIKFHI